MSPISPSSPALDLSNYLDQLQSSLDGSTTGNTGSSVGIGGQPAGTAPTGNPVSAATAFSQTLTGAIGSVAGLQQTADQAVAGLATNQGVDIQQAMIAMEQASLGMQMTVQVRDKAVEAYQSLINMQM